jgi:hemoglobin-like flavoprotein
VGSEDTMGGGALSAGDVERVRDSFARVDGGVLRVIARFYEVLFAREPELKRLFVRSAPPRQAQMFREMLYLIIDHLDDAPWVASALARLGERHAAYGVVPEMYEPVGEALIQALSEHLGDAWDAETEGAWRRAYALLRGVMLSAT